VLASYLEALQHVALLTPEDERRYWRQYHEQEDIESRLRLIEAYQPLVFKVVMSLRPPESIVMDMIQEGTIGLIEAVERFDDQRGVRFSTFATYRIRGRVLNSLRTARPSMYSLDHEGETAEPLAARLVDPSSDAALQGVEDEVAAAQMRRAIDTLPARERLILRAMYIESRMPRTVAAELRISLSHLYRLQKQALARIRQIVTEVPQRVEDLGY
jgi:RNA polymerase sporulation-specific sigma factor